MKSDREKVEKILLEHIDARGNDNALYYYYFRDYVGTTNLAVIKDMRVDKFVTLARIRRLVEKHNPFLAADVITQKGRKARQDNILATLRNTL